MPHHHQREVNRSGPARLLFSLTLTDQRAKVRWIERCSVAAWAVRFCMSNKSTNHEAISDALIEELGARLAEEKPIHRILPGGGRLNIDRLLPFLCVYRRQASRNDAGTRTFVNDQAAYLNAPGTAPVRTGLDKLVRHIAEIASTRWGAFLVVEIWSSADAEVPIQRHAETGEILLPRPRFQIHAQSPTSQHDETPDLLRFELQRVKVHRQKAEVFVVTDQDERASPLDPLSPTHPPGSKPLFSLASAQRLNCFLLGLEIRPIYRDPQTGELLPAVLRTLRHSVGRALKKAVFDFTLNHTSLRPEHYFSLGRRKPQKLVWEVDRELAEVASQFDVLLQATPVNAQAEWHAFRDSNFEKRPVYQYRPLPAEPLNLKRQLTRVPTERIEDATIAHLMRETQDDLDRQINMLSDVATPRFLPGTIQVFGAVEASLLETAQRILASLPPRPQRGPSTETGALSFADRAVAEMEHYRSLDPNFAAQAEVRDDMFSGLLASKGQLLIGRETTIDPARIEALLQHEVGTHLVTYYNGRAQPFQLLSTGLAGYDGFQEGLAVLAEYLVGGLTRSRLRTLAVRVLAVDHMTRGATFIDTFRLLQSHGFEPSSAYTITMRVYRGGGLTKDAVYLRGLVQVLDYLNRDGDLTPLFVGKLARDHVPVVRELLLRGVLREPPLRPRYMDYPGVSDKLELLRRDGVTVLDLMNEPS